MRHALIIAGVLGLLQSCGDPAFVEKTTFNMKESQKTDKDAGSVLAGPEKGMKPEGDNNIGSDNALPGTVGSGDSLPEGGIVPSPTPMASPSPTPGANPSASPTPVASPSPTSGSNEAELFAMPSPTPTSTPGANPSPSPTPAQGGMPVPPPGKTIVQLEINQVMSTASYKNCLFVTLNGVEQSIGCNKDSNALSKKVYLVADQAPACNRVSVRADTYFNQSSSCTRAQKTNGTCAPYKSTPDRVRKTSIASDREFFKAADASSVDQRDPLIQAGFDWANLKSQMVEYEKSGSWLRVFFEDLGKDVLDQAHAKPQDADKMGINFDDFIFDLKGSNVNFSIEGLEAGCQ